MTTPFVSIVVPVFDERDSLIRLLASLQAQDYPKEFYEILVVINGPLEKPHLSIGNLRWLREQKPGSYAARNTGIRASKGSMLAFTDADCTADPSWIASGVSALTVSGAGIVAGSIELYYQKKDRPNLVERYDTLFHGFDQQKTLENGIVPTANLFTRKEVIERAGPFDESFFSAGDAEWSLRVKSTGHELFYEPKAKVLHPARHQFRQMKKKMGRVVGGQYLLAKRGLIEKRKKIPNLLKLVNPLPMFLYTLFFVESRMKTPKERVGVMAIFMILRYLEAWEWVRLYLNRAPRRGI